MATLDKVKVSVPVLVNEPEPIPITPDTFMPPFPENTTFVFVPVVPPDKIIALPFEASIVGPEAVKVISPDSVNELLPPAVVERTELADVNETGRSEEEMAPV